MQTNDDGHEAAYRKFRQQPERAGWDDAEQLITNLENLVKVMQWPSMPKTGRVLELGCGAGNTCLELAKRGYEVHGVDIAPTAIDWARESD